MRARPLIALAAGLWLAALGRDAAVAWVDATVLPPLVPETSVQVLARDGTLLRAYTVADGRWRMAVGLDAVDPAYLDMLIAFEDRRFRDHAGVDPRALVRALVQALGAGGVVSGGSTLTMQVARLIEEGTTGQWAGKIRQMRVALALERRLGKDEILSLYLHLAPFGGNLEGVRAASFAWLGKEPRRLTPAEAALLVALPQSPEARRPDRHPDRAQDARDRVLARMVDAGVLDDDRARAARTEAVPTTRQPFPALAPHLADRLRAADPTVRTHRTTIDASLQARLEALARAAVEGRGERLSAAILVADHATGEILATVGSAGYTDDARAGFVDMTRALRSPGSTLKPLVYGMAFDDGLAHPETLIDDRPTSFDGYAPQNFDHRFRGTLRVREALQLSLNLPVVALAEALGPARIMAALRRAGVQAVLPDDGAPGLAVVLGGVGMSLEGLVQLYAGLARGGQAVALRDTPDHPGAPHMHDTNGGPVTAPAKGPPARLIADVAAWQVGDILASAAPPPGAPRARLAYKTGTSYGHRDAWALGYDGAHVAGVWMGRADGTPVPGVFGADLAAPLLFEVFARIKPHLAPLAPPPAATLILPNAALPRPLQRFRARGEAAFAAPDAPVLAFPPAGAEIALEGGPLLVRVERGAAPFTWLADGIPVAVAERGRETLLDLPAPGFVTLSVIDAEGRAAGAQVLLR